MKILFFIGALTSGGKERRLLELLTYLSKKDGYDLLLVTKKTEVLFPNFYHLNIKWHSLSLERLNSQTFQEFNDLVKLEKPDIIHTWGDKFTFFANLVKKINPGFKVLTSEITSAPPKLNFRTKLLSKINFFMADYVLANSEAGLKIFNPPSKKSQVIYNGMNLRRFEDLKEEKQTKELFGISTENLVVMVASYSKNKDYLRFFEVGKHLQLLRNDVTFLGVGYYDSEEPYFDECKAFTENHSKLIVRDGTSEVENLIKASSIGVLFSPNGEGLSNTILEYMALGKPVIANDAGGTKEIVRHKQNGLLITNESPEVIAQMIHELLNDPERMRMMGEQSKQRILDDFSLDRMGAEFEAVYNKLMNH